MLDGDQTVEPCGLKLVSQLWRVPYMCTSCFLVCSGGVINQWPPPGPVRQATAAVLIVASMPIMVRNDPHAVCIGSNTAAHVALHAAVGNPAAHADDASSQQAAVTCIPEHNKHRRSDFEWHCACCETTGSQGLFEKQRSTVCCGCIPSASTP